MSRLRSPASNACLSSSRYVRPGRTGKFLFAWRQETGRPALLAGLNGATASHRQFRPLWTTVDMWTICACPPCGVPRARVSRPVRLAAGNAFRNRLPARGARRNSRPEKRSRYSSTGGGSGTFAALLTTTPGRSRARLPAGSAPATHRPASWRRSPSSTNDDARARTDRAAHRPWVGR